jgi:hypothetical protein
MPRIRSIKPDFWNDEKLGQEPEAIMLTYIGLWNFSDDYGIVKANHTWLKNQIYPYKDKLRIDVFSSWLQRLSELEAIISFTYRGESFYCIRTFRKHQKVEKPSKARNCPEDILITELNKCGFILNENQVFIKSGSSRGVVGEESPLYIGREKDIGKDIVGDSPDGDEGAFAPSVKEYERLDKNKKTIYEFICINKPQFIEPYKDFWNLFAQEKSLAQVKTINDQRKRKFKVRLKEKAFNLCEILRKAAQSEYLMTSGNWFSFDWIIENDSNYLKVLEGNYDKKGRLPIPINNGPSAREKEEAENRKKLGING